MKPRLQTKYAGVIAGLITTRLKKDSIYTQKLSRRGVDLHLGIEATIMESTAVRDLMHTDVPAVSATAGFQDVLHRMLDENIEELYVTTDRFDACPDDPGDDAWPPDLDNSAEVDILDVLHYKWKLAPYPYDRRYDLDVSGEVDILDVLLYKPVLGMTCTDP